MADISAVIITLNEEKNIARCIDSVQRVASDIVVVDSYSTDRTKQICLEKGVRFFENAFTSFSEQKNVAVMKAKFDHILSLDADEYLSEELVKSITKIKETWSNEAYCMNRLSSFAGKWIRHGNWYPDRQMRLWNRKFGQWGNVNPHETVVLQDGVKITRLHGNLLHKSYANSNEAIHKFRIYAGIYAKFNAGKKKITVPGIILHSGFAFFKSYILKKGFLDGFEGLSVAMAVTNHTFYKYAKLYEENRKVLQNLPINGATDVKFEEVPKKTLQQ